MERTKTHTDFSVSDNYEFEYMYTDWVHAIKAQPLLVKPLTFIDRTTVKLSEQKKNR